MGAALTQDLMFPWWWRFKSWSSGLWCHVVKWWRWSQQGPLKHWYPTCHHNPEGYNFSEGMNVRKKKGLFCGPMLNW